MRGCCRKDVPRRDGMEVATVRHDTGTPSYFGTPSRFASVPGDVLWRGDPSAPASVVVPAGWHCSLPNHDYPL